MPTREVLSPAQRAELLTVPADLSDRELARYYTLTDDDRAVIARHRGPHNRLGFSVQLCHLRFPGWPWDPAVPLPASIVTYIAGQLELDPAELEAYAIRPAANIWVRSSASSAFAPSLWDATANSPAGCCPLR